MRPSLYFDNKGKIMSEIEKTEIIEEKTAEEIAAENKKKREEIQERARQQIEEIKEKTKIALEAIAEGKGVLNLDTPIISGDHEVKELKYDFSAITGMEYTTAMDMDPNAQQIYRITYRQGLALFATAAAKQTDYVDTRDIMERMSVKDAVEGVQLATSFFAASTREGRLRISKM